MAMKYIGGYLLAVLGGNDSPSASDVKGILAAAGIDSDDELLGQVMTNCAGKSVHEVIAEGKGKLQACGGGGGGGGGGAAAGGAAAGGAAAEEKKEEVVEEEEEDMDFDLFG